MTNIARRGITVSLSQSALSNKCQAKIAARPFFQTWATMLIILIISIGGATQLESPSTYVIHYHPPLVQSRMHTNIETYWVINILQHNQLLAKQCKTYIYICPHQLLHPVSCIFDCAKQARPSEIERSSSATAASHRRSADAPPSDGSGRSWVDGRWVSANFSLLVLNVGNGWEWMGMGLYGIIIIIISYYGSFPHSLHLAPESLSNINLGCYLWIANLSVIVKIL